MSSINITTVSTDSTVVIDDTFYATRSVINQDDYSQILSFFTSLFKDRRLAVDFTTVFFKITESYGITTHQLLTEMKGQTGLEITTRVELYLNGLRSKSTLLGHMTPYLPNSYAARNVIL